MARQEAGAELKGKKASDVDSRCKQEMKASI